MNKTFKHLASFAILLAVSWLALAPALVFGAGDITSQMQGPLTGLTLPSAGTGEQGQTKVLTIIGLVINGFLSILGVIFLILIIYGGFKWMNTKPRL